MRKTIIGGALLFAPVAATGGGCLDAKPDEGTEVVGQGPDGVGSDTVGSDTVGSDTVGTDTTQPPPVDPCIEPAVLAADPCAVDSWICNENGSVTHNCVGGTFAPYDEVQTVEDAWGSYDYLLVCSCNDWQPACEADIGTDVSCVEEWPWGIPGFIGLTSAGRRRS